MSVIKGDLVVVEVTPLPFVGQKGAAPDSSEPAKRSRAFDFYG